MSMNFQTAGCHFLLVTLMTQKTWDQPCSFCVSEKNSFNSRLCVFSSLRMCCLFSYTVWVLSQRQVLFGWKAFDNQYWTLEHWRLINCIQQKHREGDLLLGTEHNSSSQSITSSLLRGNQCSPQASASLSLPLLCLLRNKLLGTMRN